MSVSVKCLQSDSAAADVVEVDRGGEEVGYRETLRKYWSKFRLCPSRGRGGRIKTPPVQT